MSQFAANGGLQMRKKRFYTEEYRRLVVGRMKGCGNVSALAEELDVPRRLLYRWRERLEGTVAAIAPRHAGLEEENRQLKQLLAERTLEVDFFKRCLAKDSGSTPGEGRHWRDGIYDQVRSMMSLQGGLSIERMCGLARVSWAGSRPRRRGKKRWKCAWRFTK